MAADYVPDPDPIFLCELEIGADLLAELKMMGIFTAGDYKQAYDDGLLDDVCTAKDHQRITRMIEVEAQARKARPS